MLVRTNLRILKIKLWSDQYFNVQRNLASWSSVAYAFNTKPSKVKSLKSQFLGESTGIFGYQELQEPYGFYLLKENAVGKADMLMREIKNPTRKRKMVRVFDELSDTLCKVADLAEFVRIAHPQERFSYAAKETSISISSFVEELNTNKELYD
ncbi:mitochondrial intermediate peptidase [Trichonephila inaurata madagascariensis]|uniref:Mitochondrial intermediate peptidase n=1 Tax=Trichonephila inaurata madagascariensis TaxID=2747483 RepID=A0A8X6YLC4_9ARAC|nr:mitochondrial intermediate peptidase [Trichonephila inaurata madagascariensis]